MVISINSTRADVGHDKLNIYYYEISHVNRLKIKHITQQKK